jgi:hypothetical protein
MSHTMNSHRSFKSCVHKLDSEVESDTLRVKIPCRHAPSVLISDRVNSMNHDDSQDQCIQNILNSSHLTEFHKACIITNTAVQETRQT